MTTISLNSQKPLVVLESTGENTKVFNFNDKEVMLYISRGFEEDSNKHFITHDIPEIVDLNCYRIQDPIEFETAELRDEIFKSIDENYAEMYIKRMVLRLSQNKKNLEEELKKQKEEEEFITPSEEIKDDE